MNVLDRWAKKFLTRLFVLAGFSALLISSLLDAPRSARASAAPNQARLVILMAWDGLRPDSVTSSATPNLYALRSQGVYFADHHSIYPTLTMVNAAGLATAAPP